MNEAWTDWIGEQINVEYASNPAYAKTWELPDHAILIGIDMPLVCIESLYSGKVEWVNASLILRMSKA